MTNEPDKLEEKLIPYLEGVLNAKERREVDEAIGRDGDLAREMSDLREVILELRQGFASGLKPPQEELTVEEVVELGSNLGTVDGMPGSSQQKARLFCSDSALEEYGLLKALQEELAKTTLDGDNIPPMPESLKREFRDLKGLVPSARKVVPLSSRFSPVPLWRRASGMLDRIDPKPLMASAAALAMLSLGVHLYNKPAESAVSQGADSELSYNFSDETKSSPSASGSPSVAPKESNGVAVFTSDDRGLLKEQAEKLLTNKVRYTVTNDRILVAEKDLAEARGILWEDADGKKVAMGAEKAPQKRLEQPAVSADDEAASSSTQSNAPVINADQALSEEAPSASDVTLYSAPSRNDAPARPVAPSPPRSKASGSVPSYATSKGRTPAQELEAGLGRGDDSVSSYSSSSTAPARVVKAGRPADRPAPMVGSAAPAPTELDLRQGGGEASSVAAPISEDRRQKIIDLAEGKTSDSSASDSGTVTLSRARVSAAAAAAAARAPEPSVMSSAPPGAREEVSEEARTDARLSRMESARSGVAKRNGVELSFQAEGTHISVYVRSKKTLSKAEMDELRRALRQDLVLSESDTLIFR